MLTSYLNFALKSMNIYRNNANKKSMESPLHAFYYSKDYVF